MNIKMNNRVNEFMDMDDLIIKFLSGKTTRIEEEKLKNWKNKNEENNRHFNAIRNSWIATSTLASSSGNEKRILDELHIKIEKGNQVKKKMLAITSLKLSAFFKIAAVVLLLVGLGSTSGILIYKQIIHTDQPALCRYEAPLGSKAIAMLPDGTKVWLNAGSSIEYNTDFNKNARNVRLIGEGFFHVATNPEKPFIVDVSGLKVKATGTSFNIKAYPEENKIITTLVEGKVEIAGIGAGNKSFSITMKPKEKITYYKNLKQVESSTSRQPDKNIQNSNDISRIKPVSEKLLPVEFDKNVNTELYTSWKDKRWVVESEEFRYLAPMLERRFNVKIRYNDNDLGKYRFSGTIENETLEQLFNIMRMTIPLSYQIDKGVVKLNLDPHLKTKYKSAYRNQIK